MGRGVINQLWGGGISQVWGGSSAKYGGASVKYGGVINQLWGGPSAKYGGGVSIFPPVCTGSQNPQNYFSNTYVLPSVNRTAGPSSCRWHMNSVVNIMVTCLLKSLRQTDNKTRQTIDTMVLIAPDNRSSPTECDTKCIACGEDHKWAL